MKTLVLHTICSGVLSILLNDQNPLVDKIVNEYLDTYEVTDWYIKDGWDKSQLI